MIKLLIFILIIGAVIFFFWHEEIELFTEKNQQKVEEQAPGLISEGLNQSNNWWEGQGRSLVDDLVAALTSQGKAKIDQWLKEKDLNEYGDAPGTMYTGGTPLFNEQTGQSMDRYSYLLQKFPDLVKELNLDKYLSNQ